MNSILRQDLETIIQSSLIDWNKIDNHSFIITGATGLIGSIMVKAFNIRNQLYNSNIRMILPVRDIEVAKEMFEDYKNIDYIETSIENFDTDIKVDYIIHGASPTKSKYFIEKPVETIDTAVLGTKRVLDVAKKTFIKSMVYLSSMEVYGTMNSDNVEENDLGYINPLNVRSSYSEGKRMCELYSYSYYKEYNIPVKIGRIAQTFGPGISKNENRVYKVFLDAILNKQDIILKSTGSTIINYNYTTDTVVGLLFLLLNGENGEAYNVVGDKTDMTILDSANWIANEFGNNKTKVITDIPNENTGFAPDNQMILSNNKIKNLGWNCKYDLKTGYRRLLEYMKEEEDNEKRRGNG